MEPWQFSRNDLEAAAAYYDQAGYVGFPNLLTAQDLARLNAAFDEAAADGRILLDPSVMVPNPDAIYRHPVFEEYCRDPRIVDIVERLLGHGVELQHSKLNAKPGGGAEGGIVYWHQDYPFFAHTNFDLLACTIHLDAEDVDSGPLELLVGSHKWGILSHEDEEGTFLYRCSEQELAHKDRTLLTGKAGQVTMHHVLTMHRSAPRRSTTPRRHLIFQYRAEDAVQISGVVTKCAGVAIRDRGKRDYARFMDNNSVKVRGKLIDLYGKFAPDR